MVSHEFVDGVGTITFDKDVNVINASYSDYIISSNYMTDILLPSTIITVNAPNNLINGIAITKLVIPKSVSNAAGGGFLLSYSN